MQKYTNPFYAAEEAVAVLKSLGADPYKSKPEAKASSGATYPFPWGNSYAAKPEEPVCWQEHILSVHALRVYDEHGNHHFEVEIHIDREGLDTLTQMTGLNILREHHSDDYDQLVVRPGALLKVFTLEAKGATTS